MIYWVQPEDDTEAPATPETSRRKAVSFSRHRIFFSQVGSSANGSSIQLTQSDPVHALDVVQFIKHHLQKAQTENGGVERFAQEWVANVDKEVLQDFAKLEIM